MALARSRRLGVVMGSHRRKWREGAAATKRQPEPPLSHPRSGLSCRKDAGVDFRRLSWLQSVAALQAIRQRGTAQLTYMGIQQPPLRIEEQPVGVAHRAQLVQLLKLLRRDHALLAQKRILPQLAEL